jgi:TonB-linked SusC/RagA family outer membrane protein
LDQALQGKIAGVTIQNTASEAGSDPKVRVRGLSSINAGASPLVVVDGHPVPDGLSFVNMADVESVEVLKDAASAAIYGSRGASGVIIITTKTGKVDKPKYSFKMSTGYKTPYKVYDVMTTTEYTNMLYYEYYLKKADPNYVVVSNDSVNNGDRGAYAVEQCLRNGNATDWQSSGLRNAALKNIALNVSGGSAGFKYYLSGNYQNDQGMMYHSEYERFNITSKFESQLSKKAKLSFNVNPSYFKREKPSVNYIDFVRYPSYIPVYLDENLAAFVRQNPLFSNVQSGEFAQARYFNGRDYSSFNPLLPDGTVWNQPIAIEAFGTSSNSPKSVMETQTITSNEYRLLSSGNLVYNLKPGLEFKTMVSAYVNYSNSIDFAKTNSGKQGDLNKGVYYNRLLVDLLNENTLTYNKKIKENTFSFLAGFTAQKTTTREEQVTGLNFPSDNITSLNNAGIILQDQTSTYNRSYQVGLLSYLGRVNYSYKDKYLLSGSLRADGSSYFAPGRKWGYFQSVSMGWNATKEKFLKDVKWLNNLKFRASYGATGNNRISNFAFIDLLYGANYPFGMGTGNNTFGLTPSRNIFPNANITWERTFQYNGGVDISMFKNKVSLTLDIYRSKTDQLLLQQAAMALSGVPLTWNNIGQVQNDGIELQINTNNIQKKGFKWTTSANIAHTQNKILQLGNESLLLNQGERNELYMNKVGKPLIEYFGYKTDGVWLSQAQIDSSGITSLIPKVLTPGGLRIVDVNGDHQIDVNDRTIIGNPYPDFNWGITNTFKLNRFELSITFQGVQGGTLINGDANYTEIKRTNRSFNEGRWISPANPGNGKTPYSTAGYNWMLTDYVMEDASYYALRELIAGYTFSSNAVKRLKLTSLRFYFTAQNLYYHFAAGYRGINPEASFTSGPYNTPLVDGYQRGAFPVNKGYLVGVDLNF